MVVQKLDILIKCITLLYRERELSEKTGSTPTDNSKDLVRTILQLIKSDNTKTFMGGESTIVDDLKNLANDMLVNPDNYDATNLMQSLEIILKDKPSLLKVIEKSFGSEKQTGVIKRNIITIRNMLNNYYKDQEIENLISTANFKIKTNRLDISLKDFAAELVTNLEALSVSTKRKDPGIVDEIDVGDENGMDELINKVKNTKSEDGKLKTGWQDINAMLQGGFSRHESWTINALQHKYKSGFTQSLFMQLAKLNKPILQDPNKKPLITYISFEDDVEIIAEFMYRYLYYNENNELPDLDAVTSADIGRYIKERLGKTGYHVKIIRVNPSEWTFKDLFNKILEFEADGYEVHACIVDYLAKLPTTGCINTGPGGTEVRDLFNRCRNFFGSKKVLFITPHQLSTEAKQLIRNGVSDLNFVKEIAGKGYTELSKQIDQVVDGELYLHIGRYQKRPVLTVQRGKHRNPNILEEEKMYCMLPFPNKAPIKEDLGQDKEGFGNGESNGDDDFDF
jgi:hypothetical protein